MTYKTKSCPHCGHVYAWMETTHRHYGSPFRICHQCKKSFIDDSYKELACLNHKKIREKKIEPFSVICLLVGLLFLFLALLQASYPDSGDMHILFLVVGVMFVFGGGYFISNDLSSYSSRCSSLKAELSRSQKRLSNPSYAQALSNLGIDVPKEYLCVPMPVPKNEPIYYKEAANGMTVRVPESKLEAWKKAQDEIRNNPEAAKLTPEEEELKRRILDHIYGRDRNGGSP